MSRQLSPDRKDVPARMAHHPQPITLSPMGAEDLAAVAAVERECFSDPWSIQSLAAELENPLAVYYIARVGDTMAGFAGMHHVLDEGYITNIAVVGAMRRRGVASALLRELLRYADAHKMRLLTLEVRVSNTAAQSLYRAFRFEQAGLRRGYYRAPTEDALILTRIL